MWQIDIKLQENGGDISKIDSTTHKNKSIERSELSCPMINYFSVGAFSSVGLDFDKHRTERATINKACYVLMWLK